MLATRLLTIIFGRRETGGRSLRRFYAAEVILGGAGT
jgi:hypothetical protein